MGIKIDSRVISDDVEKMKSRRGLEKGGPVQQYIDKTCLEKMDKYVPFQYVAKKPVWVTDETHPQGFRWTGKFRTVSGVRGGTLQQSAHIHSKPGTGIIEYRTPYARFQYYGIKMVGAESGLVVANRGETKITTGQKLKYQGAPTRGALWFERMKNNHLKEIEKGATEVADKEWSKS